MSTNEAIMTFGAAALAALRCSRSVTDLSRSVEPIRQRAQRHGVDAEVVRTPEAGLLINDWR